MRLRSLLLVLACLLGTLAGQNGANWHRYQNTGGNFSILVPAEPTDNINPAQGGGEQSHTIQVKFDGVTYGVVYVVNASDQPVDDGTYKVFRDAFMKGLPSCIQATEEPAAPAVPGYIGHLYRMNCGVQGKKVVFVGNLYWGKRYAYATMVLFDGASSNPPNPKKFLDSFAVLNPVK